MYIPVFHRYNAKYNELDLHAALIEPFTGNTFAESDMARVAEESGINIPSWSRIRDTVELVEPGNWLSCLTEHWNQPWTSSGT